MWYYFIHVPIILLLAYIVFKSSINYSASRFYWVFFTIKMLAGVCLGLVYKYYYTSGDTFSFFHLSQKLSHIAKTDFSTYLGYLYTSNSQMIDIGFKWTPNVVMVKITSIFSLVTGSNYWLISGYFSLISFTSLWYLFLVLEKYFRENTLSIAVSLFLVPSFIFWSSGLMKESLSVAFIAFVVALFIKIVSSDKYHWIEVVTGALSLILLWKLKYFYAGVLATAMLSGGLALLISKKRPEVRGAKMMVLTVLLFVSILLVATLSHPNFYLSRIMEVIVENHHALVLKSGLLRIYYIDLEPTLGSLLINSPLALFAGLFRPLPLGTNTLVFFFSGVENLVLVVFSCWALLKLKRPKNTSTLILTTVCLLYVLILATLLALSTPNFGTLMRFKVGFLPFLYLLVLYNNPLVRRISQRLFN